MRVLFEDLHYITELKTSAESAPGPTRTHYPFIALQLDPTVLPFTTYILFHGICALWLVKV